MAADGVDAQVVSPMSELLSHWFSAADADPLSQHINDAIAAFCAAAESAGLLIMIHPLHPAGMERIGGRPELAAVAAFPLETALAATSLLAGDVTERFPGLRFLLSHGGGALPWIIPRLHHT